MPDDFERIARTAPTSAGALEANGGVTPPLPVLRVAEVRLVVIEQGRKRRLEPQLRITDPDGQPVAGAIATGWWSGGITKSVQGLAPSDASGLVRFPQEAAPRKAAQFTVDTVSGSGYRYDPAANLENSASYTP